MKQSIDLSIIIPVYNVEQYLPTCIESICGDNMQGVEMILIDDGSTDSSGEICDVYTSHHSEIKVLHVSNGGVAAARNIGLANATGKYIAYIDSDDAVKQGFLRRVLKFIEHLGNVGDDPDTFVFSYECVVTGNQNTSYSSVLKNGCYTTSNAITEIEKQGMLNFVWNKVYLRSLIEREPRIRFVEHSEPGEDILFNCRYFARSSTVELSSDILYQYYRRGNIEDSLSHKYYKDLYDKTVLFTETRRNLYDALSLTSESAKAHLAKETEYYFFKCIPNMFRPLHLMNHDERMNIWKKMLMNQDLKASIRNSDNQETLIKLFRILYGTGSAKVMDLAFSIMFRIRNHAK